jgi:hypothetical protein
MRERTIGLRVSTIVGRDIPMPHCRAIAFFVAFVAVLTVTRAEASVLITINKSTQRMTVAVDGVERWNWAVSTGRIGYDTPNGSFTALWMEADHFSKEWDDAPMPHSIFFTQKGHAIHGSYDTSHMGAPASHGCVRLAPANAAKLYVLVGEQGLPNTTVVLTGDARVALAHRSQTGDREVDDEAAIEDRADQPTDARPRRHVPPDDRRFHARSAYERPSQSYYPSTPYSGYPTFQSYSGYWSYPYRPFRFGY